MNLLNKILYKIFNVKTRLYCQIDYIMELCYPHLCEQFLDKIKDRDIFICNSLYFDVFYEILNKVNLTDELLEEILNDYKYEHSFRKYDICNIPYHELEIVNHKAFQILTYMLYTFKEKNIIMYDFYSIWDLYERYDGTNMNELDRIANDMIYNNE